MSNGVLSRLSHAWNVFTGRDNKDYSYYGPGYSYRPDRPALHLSTEKSIVSSIYTRIAIDVAAISIQHVRVDENDRYVERIKSGLDHCLNVSANIDQTGRAFIEDVALSLCDEGCVAIVPVDTSIDPKNSFSFSIDSLRVGRITQWYPDSVRVEVYNENVGYKQEVVVPKSTTAIIENPLYPIMNEPNSTIKRLIRKLNILDAIDEQSGAGKLDILIQLPYTIRSEARQKQAEQRRSDVERQLAGTKYGIAYIDGTERVVQLNRPAENNLMTQIQYLTEQVYSQLGMSKAIFDGTASAEELLNYHNRTIEPIISAIIDDMYRKFLSKTARAQGQKLMFFKDPFKLIPVDKLADIADTFLRNEILSPNEFRGIINYKPSKDKSSDELRNRNLNSSGETKPLALANSNQYSQD